MEIRHSVVEIDYSHFVSNVCGFHNIVLSAVFGRTIVRINHSVFYNNSAPSGSALISLGDSDVAIRSTNFTENHQNGLTLPDLQQPAGVIVIQHIETLLTKMSTFEMTHCQFDHNTALQGSSLIINGVVNAVISKYARLLTLLRSTRCHSC
jgi:hypothetical protein